MHVEDGTDFNHLSVDTTEEFFDKKKKSTICSFRGIILPEKVLICSGGYMLTERVNYRRRWSNLVILVLELCLGRSDSA